ncbi:MAG: hypothetical protein Q9160_005333 [Pyrenula sp. 1 TL-2023]
MDLPSLLQVTISPVNPNLQPDETLVLNVVVQSSATHGITLLKWNSPLDERAGKLGIFFARDQATGSFLEGVVIMANRLMPPKPEDVIHLEPNGKVEERVELPGLKFGKGKTYELQGKWRWMSAWRGELQNHLELLDKPEQASSPECLTNKVDVHVA